MNHTVFISDNKFNDILEFFSSNYHYIERYSYMNFNNQPAILSGYNFADFYYHVKNNNNKFRIIFYFNNIEFRIAKTSEYIYYCWGCKEDEYTSALTTIEALELLDKELAKRIYFNIDLFI